MKGLWVEMISLVGMLVVSVLARLDAIEQLAAMPHGDGLHAVM